MKKRFLLAAALAWLISVANETDAHAQARGRGGPPPTAKSAAAFDMTGYWVAVVSEEWRYRMVTPPKGEVRGVPLNPVGLKMANAWNPAAAVAEADACQAYGAPAIMRMPTRLHVTWQDDNTLRMETDAGTQTRLFRFTPAPGAPGPRSWQGESSATWERAGGRGGAGGSGSLTVVTQNLRAGLLRRNGVPYSENTVVTEYFDLAPLPGNGQVLIVTSAVEDPTYLTRPFTLSSHFKKEANASRWDPTPCTASW